MATYAVKVRSGQNITEHRIPARSKTQAHESGRELGSVINVRRDLLNEFRPKLTAQQRDALLGRLATMNEAGIGVLESLRKIEESGVGSIARVAGELRDKLAANKGLIGALEAHPQDFPTDLVALIRAGMEAGNTARAINDALEYQENIRKAKQGNIGGLLSAIGGACVAGAAVIVIQTYIVPQFESSPMLKDAAASMSWIDPYATALVVFSILMIGGIITFATLGTVIRSALPSLTDRIILLFPVYRDIVLAIRQYITFYRLSMLVSSGIRYERCMRLTAENAPPGVLKADLQRAAEAVREGRSWQDEMTSISEVDRFALKHGADRDQIARKLDAIGRQYRALYERRFASLVPTFKFISILLIAAAILIVFGKTMLPMLKFASQGVGV